MIVMKFGGSSVESAAAIDRVVSIVEARLADEPDEAVPVDRLLVRPGETLPMLLAPGRYRVESWTRERGWSAPVTVVVD